MIMLDWTWNILYQYALECIIYINVGVSEISDLKSQPFGHAVYGHTTNAPGGHQALVRKEAGYPGLQGFLLNRHQH